MKLRPSNTLRPALWSLILMAAIWLSVLLVAGTAAEAALVVVAAAATDICASVAVVGSAAAGAKGLRDAVGDWTRGPDDLD